jgi:hypothetical protein
VLIKVIEVIKVIGLLSKEPEPMFVSRRLAARERKKADDGTMTSSLDANPMTVADSPSTQTSTSAMTKEALDILMKRN